MLSRIVDDGGKMDEIDWADEPPAEGRWSVELGVDGPKERRWLVGLGGCQCKCIIAL